MPGPRGAMGVVGLALACGSVALLAACAGQTRKPERMVFEKSGATAAAQRRDEDECVRKSITQDVDGRILTLFDIDRDAYERCMRERGYIPRRAR